MLSRWILGASAGLIFFVVLAATPQAPKTVPPLIHVSCLAESRPINQISPEHPKGIERDNWTVTCSLTRDDKQIWKGPLVLPYPCPWDEASRAITEFRTKGYKDKLQ